jgi:drug/metabolite transporter (DMT)-like permease
MSPTVIGLALFAAALHATWNAALRTGADRLRAVTVMSLATTLVAIPFAILLPAPRAAAWPYLTLSSCLQVGYSIFLVLAYQRGELGQVYPIVRGSVPLLVTLGGFLFAEQQPTAPQLIGVVLVALGVVSLSIGKQRAPMQPVLLALATALIIASYATTDAVGVHRAGNPLAYATWLFLIYGALMPTAFVAIRGTLRLDIRSAETLKALAGGVVSLMAYGAVVSAFALGPAGPISALRETSVIFAAVIGRAFLNEALTIRRVFACIVVGLGAACLSS